MSDLKFGDRVSSNVCGYYKGEPGTIRGKALVQYEKLTRYVIDLDNGITISLKEFQIKKIDGEE